MKIKRIFHPVGHGAFFSEHFYDNQDNQLLNVVYDCGGGSKKVMTNRLQHIPAAFAKEYPHIHALFISHFDYDHVNGLSILCDKSCIDSSTKVFIPFHHHLMLLVMFAENEPIVQLIRKLHEIGTTIVEVVKTRPERHDNNEFESIKLDDITSDRSLEAGTRITAMVANSSMPEWYYVPFMIEDGASYKSLYDNFLEAVGNQLGDNFNLDDFQNVKDHLPQLKDI